MDKRWSKAEIAYLKKHAEKKSIEEFAQRFHVDSDTVRSKLDELGLGSAGASLGSRRGRGRRLLQGDRAITRREILSSC